MNDPQQLPLKDIHLPDPVSWWPLAPGWWLLLLILLLAVAAVWWRLRAGAPRRRIKRLRTIAAIELERLQAGYERSKDPGRTMQELSILLRRVAMTLAPRNQVAGLSGDNWISWLAATDVQNEFDSESLRLLANGPYQRTQDHDMDAVIRTCRRWLESFKPEAAGHDPV